MVRKKQNEFMNSALTDIGENPKAFWNLVNSKNNRKSLPDEMKYNNITSSGAKDTAELFNDYFTAQFNNSAYVKPAIRTFVNDNLSVIVLSVDDVYNVLLNLDISKCNGPDMIPILVYKRCAEVLAPSLTLLFNRSLLSGIIPYEFKFANVIPVFKKGEPNLVNNYRPISILPTVEKIMERCVHNVIYGITKNDININQHGFISKRSTNTQLLEFYNNVHKTLENHKQYDVTYLDLTKAFDRVPHDLLLYKLKSFGYNGTLLLWFKNYLHNRKQSVVINGCKSRKSNVTSGVPQGSILGPLLFTYYINDLFSCITSDSSVFLYADDSKIGHCINTLNDCLKLQQNLDNLVKWSKDWGLKFNSSKCVVMSFCKRNVLEFDYKIDNSTLQRVNSFTDLGVKVNTKLHWEDHIVASVKKANQRLGMIKRVTGYSVNKDVKLLCYTALVRPLVEFSSQIWFCNNVKLLKLVESLQRRSTKYILNDFSMAYKERLVSLNLLPLCLRREFLDLTYFYNCCNDLLDINPNCMPTFVSNSTYRTRQQADELLLPIVIPKYSIYQGFYQNRIPRLWNTLPFEIRDIPLTVMGHNTAFKNSLKSWFYDFMVNKYDGDNTCSWSISCICHRCRNF
jgi:hypothetical protein